MDESKKDDYPNLDPEAIDNLETARMALRWALERLRSLQPQARQGRGEGDDAEAQVRALKMELAQNKVDLEMLERRNSQYQKFVAMRPEEMRGAGEKTIREIVEREHSVARLEHMLRQRQSAIAQDEERLAAEAREQARKCALEIKQLLSGQQEALDKDYRGKLEALEARHAQQERRFAQREKELDELVTFQRSRFETESKNLYAEVERERTDLQEALKRLAEQQRAVHEGQWAEESALLQKELAYWRAKAQELTTGLAGAKSQAADAQEELQRARQEARGVEAQKRAQEALAGELERKAARLEGLSRELKVKEERCGVLDETLALEREEYARKRQELDRVKVGMQAELDRVARRGGASKGTHE